MGWGTDFASANVQVGQNRKVLVAAQKPFVLSKTLCLTCDILYCYEEDRIIFGMYVQGIKCYAKL